MPCIHLVQDFETGVRCIAANCDIAHHLSFLSWFHVYLVSKGVSYEMFDGYVVDTQCKLRYLKIIGELKDLLFDLLWCYVSPTQKDEIHQINNQVTMLMCSLVIDVGTWFLKHGLGS
jgi:hypothetical protein